MPPIQPRHSAVILLLAGLFVLLSLRWYQAQTAKNGSSLMSANEAVVTAPSDMRQPLSETCTNDIECGPGFFCREGQCSEYLYDTACQSDSDCQLVNVLHGYGCCWQGACDVSDSEEETWIAVNQESYQTDRKTFCPSLDECGPAPLCPTSQVESELVAGCVEQVCQKIEPRR